jgi:hypothetical protein
MARRQRQTESGSGFGGSVATELQRHGAEPMLGMDNFRLMFKCL